jgi:hypothetical protein
MDNNDYYHDTFFLTLSWDKDKGVGVQHEESEIIYTGMYSPPDFFRNEKVKATELISFGVGQEKTFENGEHQREKTIADLLLPIEGGIREKFLEKWTDTTDGYSKRLRLCLLYNDDEHLQELLNIPWEYIYLPKIPWEKYDSLLKQDNLPKDLKDLKYFLGLRDDISIVHCLNSNRRSSASVEKLKVTLKYLSWLDLAEDKKKDNEDSESKIFNDFVEELPKLEPIVSYMNLNGQLPVRAEHAEPTDAIIALEKHHFVHLTSHGDLQGILLKGEGGEILTPEEASNSSEEFRELKIVVLLSCLSAAGGESMALKLNRAGVPIVVGMNRSIRLPSEGRFVDGFYKTIAAWPSHGLEKAVVEGRKSIFRVMATLNDEDYWASDFGIPRLFLSSPNSTLIPERLLFGSDEMVKSFDHYIRNSLDEVKKHESITASNTEDYQKKLNEWIHKNLTRWFFFSGQSGSGKSAEIARFVNDYMQGLPLLRANAKDDQNDEINQRIKKLERTQNPKLIYHFCRNDQPETGNPLTFVQSSLVPQLIQRFGNRYYEWCPANKFPLLTGNAKDALIDFVYIPLVEARNHGENPPVIVIDGLDFIPPGHGFDSSILGLLYDYRDKLDTVARFIITADAVKDGDERTKQILATIRALTHQHLSSEQLGEAPSSEQPGVSVPLFQIMEKRFEDFFEQNSQANKKVLLEQGTNSYSLDKLYEYVLNRLSDQEVQFLDIVALAYEPLSVCDVAAIMDVSDDEIDKLLETLWPFLAIPIPKKSGNLLMFFYYSVRGYIVQFFHRQDNSLKFFHHNPRNYVLQFFHKKDNSLKFFHHSLRDYWWRCMQDDKQNPNRSADAHDLFIKAFLPPEVLPSNNDNKAKPDWANLCGTPWQKRCAPDSCTGHTAQQNNSLIPSYVRRYLGYHAYECYRGIKWSNKELRRKRAIDFLKLIGDPGFRTVRLAEMGRDAVVQDIRHGLRVVYTEYALPSNSANNKKDDPAVRAIDKIMAANEFDLQNLERQLRNGQAGVPALFEFLGLDPHRWEAQWKSGEAGSEIKAEELPSQRI